MRRYPGNNNLTRLYEIISSRYSKERLVSQLSVFVGAMISISHRGLGIGISRMTTLSLLVGVLIIAVWHLACSHMCDS